MYGFEYKYITFLDVINNITIIYDYSIIEFIILVIGLIFILVMNLYIIPTIRIYIEYRKIEKETEKRKEFLRKIKLQKDIEDKIAIELNIR
ncbi:hypothetical protein HUU51_04300 [Candidatus Gracilibacteria bacterium]|nr:hypothetical protein [Candidatus Gracilibacteria bacterium]